MYTLYVCIYVCNVCMHVCCFHGFVYACVHACMHYVCTMYVCRSVGGSVHVEVSYEWDVGRGDTEVMRQLLRLECGDIIFMASS